jgi:hypothetical protein
MNYITGLSIGLSIGRQLHSLFFKKCAEPNAAAGGFELLHSLTGRRRYRNSVLINNKPLAEFWQAQMLRLPKVKRVEMNIYRGTFLIEYDCSGAVIDRLMACLANFKAKKPCSPPAHHSVGHIGIGIHRAFNDINDCVREMTRNRWDLSTFLAVIFTFWGIYKIITLRQLPSGPQMLWWAYGLLKGRVVPC